MVAKIPRFPLISLIWERRLGTQMKATGEVMAIGRNIEESLLKACRSLEIGDTTMRCLKLADATDDALVEKIVKAQDDVSSTFLKPSVVVILLKNCQS